MLVPSRALALALIPNRKEAHGKKEIQAFFDTAVHAERQANIPLYENRTLLCGKETHLSEVEHQNLFVWVALCISRGQVKAEGRFSYSTLVVSKNVSAKNWHLWKSCKCEKVLDCTDTFTSLAANLDKKLLTSG